MNWPRVRFTVRRMMLVVLVVGALLGWRVEKARKQGLAVAAARQLNGNAYFDYDLNNQGRYSPNFRPPRGPQWLRALLGPEYFRTLSTLWIRQPIPDGDFSFLGGLTELRTLHLVRTNVTDADLAPLRSMPYLWGLDLTGSPRVGDASAPAIGYLTGLKELYLNGTQFTDRGLACIRDMRGLRTLFLQDVPLTDAGLENLDGLAGLESLALSGTQVTDAGLVHVGRLEKLWGLGLDGTRITDAGLDHLKGLTSLKRLSLDRTNVTEAGVARLREALPGATISSKK